jgi:hypothetical protein
MAHSAPPDAGCIGARARIVGRAAVVGSPLHLGHRRPRTTVLTKEEYLLVAFSVAGRAWFRRERRWAAALVAGATAPLAFWSVWLLHTTQHGSVTGGNLAFLGVLRAARFWGTIPSTERDLAVLTAIGVILAGVVPLFATPLVRLLAWPWVVLALSTSGWIWTYGNDAARVLPPIWVLATLSLAVWVRRPRAAEPISQPG